MAHFVILLSLLCVIHATDYNRRCLLLNGKCVAACPRNMYPYHTRCDGETVSLRTCESPVIHIIGYTCGWSRCDCNSDLLFDEDSGYCVKDKECPLYPTRRPEGTRKRKNRRRYHYSKRIVIKNEELTHQI